MCRRCASQKLDIGLIPLRNGSRRERSCRNDESSGGHVLGLFEIGDRIFPDSCAVVGDVEGGPLDSRGWWGVGPVRTTGCRDAAQGANGWDGNARSSSMASASLRNN